MRYEGEPKPIVVGDSSGIRAGIMDAVLDLGQFGELMGIELLGLFAEYPRMARSMKPALGQARVTWDEEADGIAIHLAEGRSFDQVVVSAALVIGPDDELLSVAVSLPWEPPWVDPC